MLCILKRELGKQIILTVSREYGWNCLLDYNSCHTISAFVQNKKHKNNKSTGVLLIVPVTVFPAVPVCSVLMPVYHQNQLKLQENAAKRLFLFFLFFFYWTEGDTFANVTMCHNIHIKQYAGKVLAPCPTFTGCSLKWLKSTFSQLYWEQCASRTFACYIRFHFWCSISGYEFYNIWRFTIFDRERERERCGLFSLLPCHSSLHHRSSRFAWVERSSHSSTATLTAVFHMINCLLVIKTRLLWLSRCQREAALIGMLLTWRWPVVILIFGIVSVKSWDPSILRHFPPIFVIFWSSCLHHCRTNSTKLLEAGALW